MQQHDNAHDADGHGPNLAPRKGELVRSGDPDRRRAEHPRSAGRPLASFPVPSCADPQGFFAGLLNQIVTVTGEVGPDATLTDLQQAINQLSSVFSLESDFTAEVKQTTGS